MDVDARIAHLEAVLANTRARMDMMLIGFCSLLAGELNEDVISIRKESLIANTLNTNAPDETADGYEYVCEKIAAAISARNLQQRSDTPPA